MRRLCAGTSGMWRQVTRGFVTRTQAATRPPVCWHPDAAAVGRSNLTAFADTLVREHRMERFANRDLADYRRLHAWSVSNPGAFWRAVWDYVGFVGDLDPAADVVEPGSAAWASSGNPSAQWFPNARVNHAENLLVHGADDSPALIFASETRRSEDPLLVLTYKQLRGKVGALAAALAADGVGPGDCCAGYVANTPDAVVAMLAATSLGASWAMCSPDFGQRGVMDRLGQAQPKVLFVHDRYYYRGKRFDMAPKVDAIASFLPTTTRTVVLSYPSPPGGVGGAAEGERPQDMPRMPGVVRLEDYVASHTGAALQFERAGFNTPVYIMFSSGTTGAPKCMVQGCGPTFLKVSSTVALHRKSTRALTCQNLVWTKG